MYRNGGQMTNEMAGITPMTGLANTDPAVDPALDVGMAGMDMPQLDQDPQSATAPPVFGSFAGQQPLPQDLPTAGGDSFALAAPDSSSTGAGAGPLPQDFGATNPTSTGTTLTEFTKRRNWSQRVLEELRDFLHILTPDGHLLYVSPSCTTLTGWEPNQLLGRYIGDFIHPDDLAIFTQEFSESVASGNPLRFFYRFRKSDDSWTIFEAHGHPHLSNDPTAFAPQNTYNCRGFFMMSRPYPTKNAALLDSFLEHKIENERLMKRIAELKREEADELAEEDAQWKSRGDVMSSVATSETHGPTGDTAAYNAMPPPAKPAISNTALTRQNLDEALAASKPDSINDKMARYEGTTHLETIEMLTGLRYRDGERSQGISTGDSSPLLIRGDVGIQISVDRDARSSSDRKKKLKIADEYVCTDCGTLDSPEWRKGPNGPKTLCNACGLRWAKKEKKRQSQSQNRSQSQNQSHAGPTSGPLGPDSRTSSS